MSNIRVSTQTAKSNIQVISKQEIPTIVPTVVNNVSNIKAESEQTVVNIPVKREYEHKGDLPPYYTGITTATPNADTQVFATGGTIMTKDFIVNPIPSNYGLVTWNGSTLTIS